MRLRPTTAAMATAAVTRAARDARFGGTRLTTTAAATHVSEYAAWPEGYADRSVTTSGAGGRGRSSAAFAMCTPVYVSARPTPSTSDSTNSRRIRSTIHAPTTSATVTGNAPRLVTTFATSTSGATCRRFTIRSVA